MQQNRGAFALDVTNYGRLGNPYPMLLPDAYYCFPDVPIQSLCYPKGGNVTYKPLIGLWVGAVVRGDTLVSTGARETDLAGEFYPVDMVHKSTVDPSQPEYAGAVSEQDFIATYTDTVALYDEADPIDYRMHRPMNIEVTQSSYSWSYKYAENFILLHYSLRNMGDYPSTSCYAGLYVWPDVFQIPWGALPDDHQEVIGYRPACSTAYGGCIYEDTINLAWYAHYSGRLRAERPDEPLPHIAGIRLIDITGSDRPRLSYNWWTAQITDEQLFFGPEMHDRIHDHFSAGKGNPIGDRLRYHLLRNGEIDYDPAYTPLIPSGDPVWLYPNQDVVSYLPYSIHTPFLLSAGPYDLAPGERQSVTFAYVMGRFFHTDPDNAENIRDVAAGYDPDAYYANVDFAEISANAVWASWVYDNPGFDTDGDGYAGEYRLCCRDSAVVAVDSSVIPPDTSWEYNLCRKQWYMGDGVPDFRPAAPPPAPSVWVEPDVGLVRIRWNGTLSETTDDIFMHMPDFEGYRVYYSRDQRVASFTMVASCDRENFDKHIWNAGWGEWQVLNRPYTIEELTCLYGDSCRDPLFNPLLFTRSNPLYMPDFPDSIFYFTAHDFNRSHLGVNTPITKVYPGQPYPSSIIPDSAENWELTEEGFLKFFEYQCIVENLLPTVPYYFNVTAFDCGSPESGVDVLETARQSNAVFAYAMPDAEAVIRDNLEAYVYPNPYRIDGDYLGDGYEGRDSRWPAPERSRLIHFANLPPRCWIRVFSLDGDLIRELRHDRDPSDPDASHHTWDMITRNTQALVSGIYYWTVEDDYGHTQIGKLVVIK